MVGDRESVVRIVCAERLSVAWLNSLLNVPVDRLLPVLRDFAWSAENEWQFSLAGLLAARVGSPAFNLALDIAGDETAAWGPRTVVLSWLRHASRPEGERLADVVRQLGDPGDFDALRLQVVASGYLGNRLALSHVSDREKVRSTHYTSEKLSLPSRRTWMRTSTTVTSRSAGATWRTSSATC